MGVERTPGSRISVSVDLLSDDSGLNTATATAYYSCRSDAGTGPAAAFGPCPQSAPFAIDADDTPADIAAKALAAVNAKIAEG